MKFGKILLPLLLLGVAACGGKGDSASETAVSESATTVDTVTATDTATTVDTTTVDTVTTAGNSTATLPSISEVAASMTIDFSGVAKDEDLSNKVMSGWTIKASKFSYLGAAKLQYADNHIISPTITKTGAVNVKMNIFATGSVGTPWQFDIVGLNASGVAVETKTVAFTELPNTQANFALRTWTLTNAGDTIKSVKIVYVQKLTGANIGIVNAEIA